ncbi:transporter [Pseudoalteromonas phenolica]|uniref:Transporter n=1 Tax=Pseudoalteromonas phenolica TaxID=161398 RepID=A0A4Q7IKK0_9GAMM|nr:mechanosensitive ion channel domain-containing protein [Pseudoalteromonas phenolica]RZQ51989.1 transporter [Pseudoalteromonas phenolica]
MTEIHLTQLIEPWLQQSITATWLTSSVANVIGITGICLLYLVIRRLVLPSLQNAITRFSPSRITPLSSQLSKLSGRLSALLCCVLFLGFYQRVFVAPDWLFAVAKVAGQILLVIFSGLMLSAFTNLGHGIYLQLKFAKDVPIQGLVQVAKLITFIVCAILVISILINKSPTYILSGFGAIAAVTLLVFKDTILGLVASIQIAANRLVSIGDWIQVDAFGADGEVLDLGLNTVRVRNWDNTITTIPTYLLISDSFKNWRAMQQSAGRRIKRPIYVDMHSLQTWSVEKAEQVAENIGFELATEQPLSNVSVYRLFAEYYLKNHPKINQECVLMVRSLAPSEKGLGLEVYCFSRNTQWVPYEQLQAEIIEYLIAALEKFELKPYQAVTGQLKLD